MPTLTILGQKYILKQLRAPRFKKMWTIATPPPWYQNPSRLSKGQVAQIVRFSTVAHETAGRKLAERMMLIRARASGPTGYRVTRPRIPLARFGPIVRLAEAYGIPVPEALRAAAVTAPAVAPAAVAAGIRE